MINDYTGPVDLAPLDVLIREIQQRTESSIICVSLKDNKPRNDLFGRFYHGNYSTCIGMAEQIKYTLLAQIERGST